MRDKVQILVEKERHFIPRTARQLMGFPIEYEWKEVSVEEAIMRSELVMPDGRPMSAWWFEIQQARERKPDLEKREQRLREQFIFLRVAEWATAGDPLTGDVLIRFKPSLARPEEIANNPEKFCEKLECERHEQS
jgi:hypothetical protein